MKGEMRIMFPLGATRSPGDQKIEWDTDEVATVDKAAATFAQLLLQGHVGFITSTDGPAHKLEEFDPEAGRIVVVMPMAGG